MQSNYIFPYIPNISSSPEQHSADRHPHIWTYFGPPKHVTLPRGLHHHNAKLNFHFLAHYLQSEKTKAAP